MGGRGREGGEGPFLGVACGPGRGWSRAVTSAAERRLVAGAGAGRGRRGRREGRGGASGPLHAPRLRRPAQCSTRPARLAAAPRAAPRAWGAASAPGEGLFYRLARLYKRERWKVSDSGGPTSMGGAAGPARLGGEGRVGGLGLGRAWGQGRRGRGGGRAWAGAGGRQGLGAEPAGWGWGEGEGGRSGAQGSESLGARGGPKTRRGPDLPTGQFPPPGPGWETPPPTPALRPCGRAAPHRATGTGESHLRSGPAIPGRPSLTFSSGLGTPFPDPNPPATRRPKSGVRRPLPLCLSGLREGSRPRWGGVDGDGATSRGRGRDVLGLGSPDLDAHLPPLRRPRGPSAPPSPPPSQPRRPVRTESTPSPRCPLVSNPQFYYRPTQGSRPPTPLVTHILDCGGRRGGVPVNGPSLRSQPPRDWDQRKGPEGSCIRTFLNCCF